MSITRITEAVVIDYDDETDDVTVTTDFGEDIESITIPFIQFENAYTSILKIRGSK